MVKLSKSGCETVAVFWAALFVILGLLAIIIGATVKPWVILFLIPWLGIISLFFYFMALDLD